MDLKRICNCCEKEYGHPIHYKFSKKKEEYMKYLGYCCNDCYCGEVLKDNNDITMESIRAFFNELKLKEKYK